MIFSTISVCFFSIFLSGCAPILIGGAAMTGLIATQDKSITSTLSDSQVSAKIISKVYKYSKHMQTRIGVTVHGGEVLLTGTVNTSEEQLQAEKLAWEVVEVRAVHNYIEVSDEHTFGSYTGDSIITTSIKSKLLFTGDVCSSNISVKTVRGIVYLMGIVRSKAEQVKVIDAARNTSRVKKVISLLRLKPVTSKSVSENEEESVGQEETENDKSEAEDDEE